MDGGGDLDDVLLEEPEGVRVREHDPGDVVVEDVAQLGEVDAAALVGAHRGHLEAAEGDRGGVGAVGGVGDHDPPARRTGGLVVGAHQQEAGQLPRRARRRLQRGGGHPRQRAEARLELDERLEPPLHAALGGGRVDGRRSPGMAASSSQNLGLYFIVQEPSG